jgi:hypothetical protein
MAVTAAVKTTVNSRGRNDADLGNLTIFDFAQKLSLEIKEKN